MNSKKTIFILIGICVFFIAAELLSRLAGISPSKDELPKFSPKSLYEYDSLLGWKNAAGNFSLFADNDDTLFTCSVNSQGHRITSHGSLTESYKSKLHIYGCSYIFGYSVDDTATSCYKLQQMLPQTLVVNKGVPAYSLAQMYLSLQQSLAQKDTPSVAIFNYSDFHDLRRPSHHQWGNMIRHYITNNQDSLLKKMRYPYFDFYEDSLQQKYCDFNNLPSLWSLSAYSSFSHLINSFYFLVADGSMAEYNHLVSKMTAIEIMAYCKKNGIEPIFATILYDRDQNSISQDKPASIDIPIALREKGFHTLEYGIDIADRQYNCFPVDEGHPNNIAHTVFAQKTYAFLTEKNFLARN